MCQCFTDAKLISQVLQSHSAIFVDKKPQHLPPLWRSLPQRPRLVHACPALLNLWNPAIKGWLGYADFREKNSATFENVARFSPSKTRNFISDICSSSFESMVALTPTLCKWSKLSVYTLLIENKLTDLWAIKYSFSTHIICVDSCTWKDRSKKSPDIFWLTLTTSSLFT